MAYDCPFQLAEFPGPYFDSVIIGAKAMEENAGRNANQFMVSYGGGLLRKDPGSGVLVLYQPQIAIPGDHGCIEGF